VCWSLFIVIALSPALTIRTKQNTIMPTPSAVPAVAAPTEEDEWLFSCRCESAKVISTLLSCLKLITATAATTTATAAHREELTSHTRRKSTLIHPVTVFCSPSSITFQVYGTARQSQASVEINSTLFSDYRLLSKPPPSNGNGNGNGNGQDDDWQAGGEFCVNLTTVLECLHVLGLQNLDRTKLCLSYNLTEEIFKMELLEEGILSTAAIPGMMPPDDNGNSLALAFRSTPTVARIILKSEYLREAMQELDLVHGATCCTVSLGPSGLQLAAVGHVGECLISLPSGGTSIIQLDCTDNEARTYPLHSLQSGMQGLEIAEETCITINEAGMVAIQHQVLDTVTQKATNFVDFIMSCLQDDDDDNDDDDNDEHSSSNGLLSQRASVNPTPSMSMGWDDNNVVRLADARSLTADDESEDDLPVRPTSAVPLFGTIAMEGTNRAIRRRRSRSSQSARTWGEERIASERPAEESDDELDVVAAPSSPRRRRRMAAEQEDCCSSPEIVYD
jgi:Repair protein Rad1/Rec1/Rad17